MKIYVCCLVVSLAQLVLISDLHSLMPGESPLTNSSSSSISMQSILVLPLRNETDKKKYQDSEVVRSIIFHSLYENLGLMPDFNVLPFDESSNIPADTDLIRSLSRERGASLALYGDYRFTGDIQNPVIEISMFLMDSRTGSLLISKNLSTSGGTEIFEAVDRMMSELIRKVLNTEYTNSYIAFKDLRPGPDRFDLLINGKKAEMIGSGRFDCLLKVFPGINYNIKLVNEAGGAVLLDKTLNLAPGETKSVTYDPAPYGNIEAGLRVSYNYSFDNYFVSNESPNMEITNISEVGHIGLFLDSDNFFLSAIVLIPIYSTNYYTIYNIDSTKLLSSMNTYNDIEIDTRFDYRFPIRPSDHLSFTPFVGLSIPFTIYTSPNTNGDGYWYYNNNLIDHIYINAGIFSDMREEDMSFVFRPSFYFHYEITDLLFDSLNLKSYYITPQNTIVYAPRNLLYAYLELRIKYYPNGFDNGLVIEPYVNAFYNFSDLLFHNNTYYFDGGNYYDVDLTPSIGIDIGFIIN